MLTDATAAATEAFGIFSALESGVDNARMLLAAGLIDSAALRLQGETRVVALKKFGANVLPAVSRQEIESAIYA
jgi:hypothetical protein